MNNNMRTFGLRLWVFAAVSATILWFSITPSPPNVELLFCGWDKAQHALAYAVLTLAAGDFFGIWKPVQHKAWEWSVVYAAGWGGLMEVLQGLGGIGRLCEWGDLLADLVGALVIYGVVAWRRSLSRQ